MHHLQYAILEAKKEFEINHGVGNKMNACNSRMNKDFYNNREKYGPRENFESVKEYLKEDKSNLERFYIQADMFDPRFETLAS